MSRGKKSIRDSLRFDALAGIDDQQRTFACRQRARNFVGKIDVSRRVDQIQPICVSIFRGVMEPNAFGFDGDAALALQVHGVEHLLMHLA